MKNISENRYENAEEYCCELKTGEARARELLRQLKTAEKEWENASDELALFRKNKSRDFERCQAKMAEYSEQIEKVKRYKHWYFYFYWWFLYMICAACSTGAGALVLGLLADSKNFSYLIVSLIAFPCIYIPFRRWSLRVAEPKESHEGNVGVDGWLFMVCVPVLSLFSGYLFLLPIRGLKNGLYHKEQELLAEWEKYNYKVKDYKLGTYEDILDDLSDEAYKRYWEIIDELDSLYRCENCIYAMEGEIKKTYTCMYQSGLFIGNQSCNVKL